MKRTVKIAVLKREYYQDLADQYLADPQKGPCARVKEGQTFLVSRETTTPFPMKPIFAPAPGMWSKTRSTPPCKGANFIGTAG